MRKVLLIMQGTRFAFFFSADFVVVFCFWYYLVKKETQPRESLTEVEEKTMGNGETRFLV